MHEKFTLKRYYMTQTGCTRCAIKDMYMLCIWYSEIIIIIENKCKCPLYAGSFVSWG